MLVAESHRIIKLNRGMVFPGSKAIKSSDSLM